MYTKQNAEEILAENNQQHILKDFILFLIQRRMYPSILAS